MDAGDALFRAPAVPAGEPGRPLRERAALVARVLVRCGAAAVNVGRLDLAAGLGFLEALAGGWGVPWVSANLFDAEGRRTFPAWRIARWGAGEVGIVGLTRPSPGDDARLGIRVDDPAEALQTALGELRGRGVETVIVLSNLGLEAEKDLAKRVPGVAFLVGGGTYPYLPEPPVVGDTVILHAGDRGRFLGVLETDAASLGRWRDPVNGAQEGIWRARLAAAEAELQNASPDTAPAVRNTWDRQAAVARAALERLATARARFTHRIVPLAPGVPEDPEVSGWVRRVTGSPPPVPPRPAAPAARATHTGSAGCRGCHPRAYRNWVNTPHARAYGPLRGKKPDPACLECHATRMVREGGAFTEPTVACEACHGPGVNHRGRGNIVRSPPPATCRRCHRGYHRGEEAFDFPKARDAIRCPEG
ncbi:multiheme c-type cytochrome [Deferrisoma palaeochoriense]